LAGFTLLAEDRRTLTSVDELKQRLTFLLGMFDYVLIDAPGVSVCGDAAVLGYAAGAAVLVVEANITRRVIAREAKETLEAANVHLLGTVLSNRTFPIPEQLYRKL
jgi:Mrp family chromosome partitioning ATPase